MGRFPRPAVVHSLVALTQRQEVAEPKIPRLSLGVTTMDKIRNEYMRGVAQVEQFGDKGSDRDRDMVKMDWTYPEEK